MLKDGEPVYRPRPEDIARVIPRTDMLKVSGDGAFATLQGEGVTSGLPAVFLRLHYCNLTCGAGGGWKCDTGYAWDTARPEFWREPEDWSYADAATKVDGAWKEKFGDVRPQRIVITGGEPLIQQRKIVQLLRLIPTWDAEIETNGTIMPVPELANCQFNCSPKLENSGNLASRRYRPAVLAVINRLPRSQFKFVVAQPTDLDEVDHIVRECDLLPAKILIMPEGHTAEDVRVHMGVVEEEARKKGWRVTLRNQLVWFGPKRRT